MATVLSTGVICINRGRRIIVKVSYVGLRPIHSASVYNRPLKK